MTHVFSLLPNLSAGMIPALIALITLPVIALISCWRSKDRGIIGKLFWTIFIILTWWPFMAFGAMVYGLFNFRPIASKIASIVAFGIINLEVLSSCQFFRSKKWPKMRLLIKLCSTRKKPELK